MAGKNYYGVCILGILLLPGLVAVAAPEGAVVLDEIITKDGSRIYGTVTGTRDKIVKIDTTYAGTLSIKADAIESIQTQGSMTLQLADGTIIKDKPIQVEEEIFALADDRGVEVTYRVDEILLVNPEPWELGDGYKWSGQVSFAWELVYGNSETKELDYKGHSIWRSIEDRYTLKLEGEIDEANQITNAENATAIGKYDRFLADDNYWGVNLSLETDEFADLDLRTYLGPYYGRQFFDKPIFRMSAEVGLAYVDEQFITAENQDYPGAKWDVQISSNYLGKKSRLYLDHNGLWNMDTPEDLILNLTLGLSIPLLDKLEVAAEILLEYDSGAVKDVDELDHTYNFRIGYGW